QGVWLHRHDGTNETWHRLTPWVRFGDGSADWEIGTDPGPAAAVLERGVTRTPAASQLNGRMSRP
ncbi:MAG: hypothetical protein AAFP84_22720, partial [Actinomycetota bacterium]